MVSRSVVRMRAPCSLDLNLTSTSSMEAIGPIRQGAVVTVAALGAPTPAPPRTRFSLPPGLEAGSPPEARGLARDQVRLLVARPGGIEHARFRQLDRFLDPGDLLVWLAGAGRPIRYGYVQRSWPLSAYQTVFAREPGSAEMPSAGRPFTTALVTRLVAGGVAVAPLLLHTGVASLEAGEPPLPERFRVPAATARV